MGEKIKKWDIRKKKMKRLGEIKKKEKMGEKMEKIGYKTNQILDKVEKFDTIASWTKLKKWTKSKIFKNYNYFMESL